MTGVRRLVLVLGDQLSEDNPALRAAEPMLDRVLMIEARGEAAHVPSHKARIALFLSAMRHFAQRLRASGWDVDYVALDDPRHPQGPHDLAGRLEAAIARHRPQALSVCEPGEWRVLRALQDTAARASLPLEVLEDSHFLCPREEFERWARGLKSLRMEFFYRKMRARHGVLMRDDGEPEGGRWSFDAENRSGYPKSGPGEIPPPARFEPDAITREVLALVEREFAGHPGSLAHFAWPVTREQALEALARFVDARLVNFGAWQDAMWTDTPFGWHALLSSSLNLKLIGPRETLDAALRAWRERGLPLASVEGFVRQVLGWREFIRGVYWLDMPGLAGANGYGHAGALPAWYWTGETSMACMRDAIGQTMRHGFAHHIQRLMVTGNFALLAQVRPAEVADWYLAVYVDAVEWAELPNVAGMALHANGGRFTSKPYVASGAYLKRMSNYCAGCRYRPEVRTGPRACPFTTLYWNFLDRHERALASNPRTVLMARGVARLGDEARDAIRAQAARTLENLDRL